MAGVGISRGIIGQDIFSVMVLMVLVTTMITPLMLRYVFPPVAKEARADVFESIGTVEKDESAPKKKRKSE